jgi:uncharacterized SAM-binding protein YcdF (DUF218 family)
VGIIRKIFRPGLYGLGLLIATFAAVALWSWAQPLLESPPGRADAIVCLGGEIDDVGRIGPYSSARADRCVELYHAGHAPVIAFTGAGRLDYTRDVAQQMADRARAALVPEEAIITDPKARSTLQNALFTPPLLSKTDHIILVTDGYHLPRSWVSFKLAGAQRVTLIASQTKPRSADLSRETVAIWFNLLRYPLYLVAQGFNIDGAVALLE